jgi:hypothetical protein
MADKDGNSIDPAQVGMPDFPKEMRLEVFFESKKCDMTELTIKHYDWPVSDGGQMYVWALAGWHQSVDKLAESLKQ